MSVSQVKLIDSRKDPLNVKEVSENGLFRFIRDNALAAVPNNYPVILESVEEDVVANHNVRVQVVNEHVAYVYREMKNVIVNINKKYFPRHDEYSKVPDISYNAVRNILLHEFGHVYFGHMDMVMSRRLRTMIEDKYNNSKYANSNKSIGSNKDGMTYENFIDMLCIQFFNIAMDLEVNSKFYTPKQYLIMAYELNNMDNVGEEQMKVVGVHPDLMEFPRQLSCAEYLRLLLEQDFDKTMEDYQKAMRMLMELSNYANKKGKGEFDLPNDVKIKIEPKPGTSSFTTKAKIGYSPEIQSMLISLVQKDFLPNPNRNLLYNYNRGKITDYILPRVVKTISPVPRRVIFLTDVSSSMDSDLIVKIIGSISRVNLGKDNRVVLWNTHLVQDCSSSELLTTSEVDIGGGTDLSAGIKFVDKTLTSNCLVILTSDFEDNLDQVFATLDNSRISLNNIILFNIVTSGYRNELKSYLNFHPERRMIKNMTYQNKKEK